MTVKTKKIILGVIAALAGLIAILGIVAPTQMHVEETIVVNRPVSQVFSYLQSLKAGEEWSPWFKIDPNIQLTYSGPDDQVGGKVAWAGNKDIGVGEMEVTNIVPNQRIDYALHFKEPMEGKSTSWFTTTATGDGATEVKWGTQGPMPFPMNIVGLLIDCEGMMKKVFNEGLANIKAALEK